MAKITHISAREILNAKGNPTIETTLITSDDVTSVASCPSGTSIGSYEAVELHDDDSARFNGLGLLKAIYNVETVIAPKITGMEVTKLPEIDKIMLELDGTQNKSRLGANAMLSVSMAVAKAGAESSVLPLFLYLRQFVSKSSTSLKIPTPIFNIMNGGKHGSGTLDFQEFAVVPATAKSYDDGLLIGFKSYHALKDLLQMNNMSTLVGDEGGFEPAGLTNVDACKLLTQAIDNASFHLGLDVFVGLDAAANTFYKEQRYTLKEKGSMSTQQLIRYYEELMGSFHMLYFEDILAEDDWEGWTEANTTLSKQALVVGDDLIATNPYRLQMAIDKKAITGVVIKPNQIGTVLETLAVVEVARAAGLKIIVSHRSGETNDDFIADFAVAVGADYTKFGAPARGERVAKYNRLLQIEKQLKKL